MKYTLNFAIAVGATILISWAASAAPKGIAVLTVDNQSDLSEGDVSAVHDRVTAAFKLLPSDQYVVGKLTSAAVSGTETEPCNEACLVGKAGKSGAGFAIHIVAASLPDRIMVSMNLFNAQSGQLIASETASSSTGLINLVSQVDFAAKKLSDALPKKSFAPETRPSVPPSHWEEQQEDSFRNPNAGRLIVTSTPSGADVFVGGRMDQRRVGTTPYDNELVPHHYRIVVSLKGYSDETRDVALYMGEIKTVRFNLFKSKRWIAVGHGLFWPGVILGSASVILFSNDKTSAGAALAAIGGTLIAVGLPVMVMGYLKLKREKADRKKHSIALGPMTTGFSLHYTKNF
jgi:hypothetical protein